MTTRFAAATVASLFALQPAWAEESGRFTLNDYPERMEAAIAACEAAPDGGVCQAHLRSVLPSTVDALSFLGYETSYADSGAFLREFAAFPQPHIQAAAIYALARLGATIEDFGVFRDAVLSDIPAVRRAGLGALKLMPDAAAQQIVARAVTMPSGTNFEADALPFDPAQASVATWPEGARFLHFQPLFRKGTYVFIASADAASTLAVFETQAGTKAVGMGEIEARFGAAYGDLLTPWIERNATLGAVQAVILKDVANPSESDPVTLALVYEDYALGATGFALVRLPGEELPRPARVAEVPPPAPTGDAAIWWGKGKFTPKDGAAADDVAAWRAVLDADGVGAADYLAAFPNGAYRAEAEALVNGPTITTDQDVYTEADTIKVTWRGLPADVQGQLTLGRAGDERLSDTQATEKPDVTTPEGTTELAYYSVIEPGVYDLRLIDNTNEAIAVTQIRIGLAAAELSIARDSFKPGEDIAVAFRAMGGKPRDLITIAKKGTPLDETGAVRVETGGGVEGKVTLTAPKEPGEYELRAWFERDPRLRARVAFTVRGPDAPPEINDAGTPTLALAAESLTANETIAIRFAGFPANGASITLAAVGAAPGAYIAYADVKTGSGLAEMKLPPEPGAYEMRAVVGGAVAFTQPLTIKAVEGAALATLTLAKTSFAPGETIEVDFSGMSGARNDYVAVAATGARYSQYESYVYTKGETAGRAELKAPIKPGTYEIRAFFNEDATILRGSVTITVAGL